MNNAAVSLKYIYVLVSFIYGLRFGTIKILFIYYEPWEIMIWLVSTSKGNKFIKQAPYWTDTILNNINLKSLIGYQNQVGENMLPFWKFQILGALFINKTVLGSGVKITVCQETWSVNIFLLGLIYHIIIIF